MLSRKFSYKFINLQKCPVILQRPYCLGPDRVLPVNDHRTWSADGAVRISISSSPPPISVPTLFRTTVENLPNRVALGVRGPSGEDLTWTYSQYHDEVAAVAKAFINLGLERFHSVGILGYNSPEWVISNVAAVHAGGFATGLYMTSSPGACQFVAHDSRANIMVVEDDTQLQKILQVSHRLPKLCFIAYFDNLSYFFVHRLF